MQHVTVQLGEQAGGREGSSLQSCLINLNFCIQKVDTKCWLGNLIRWWCTVLCILCVWFCNTNKNAGQWWFCLQSLWEFFITFEVSINFNTHTASGGGSFVSGQRCPSYFMDRIQEKYDFPCVCCSTVIIRRNWWWTEISDVSAVVCSYGENPCKMFIYMWLMFLVRSDWSDFDSSTF